MATRVLNWDRITQSVRAYPLSTVEMGFWQVVRQDAALQRLLPADPARTNDIMQLLFTVFRTSIQQTNADKQYFLSKLAETNAISDALSDYVKDLVGGTDDSAEGPYRCRSKAKADSWMPAHVIKKPVKKTPGG